MNMSVNDCPREWRLVRDGETVSGYMNTGNVRSEWLAVFRVERRAGASARPDKVRGMAGRGMVDR